MKANTTTQNRTNIYRPILFWWMSFTLLWGVYRLFKFPEAISEMVAKPLIWLGITALFFSHRIIPKKVLTELKTQYLHLKPIWKIFILPGIGISLYFALINFRQIHLPPFSISLLSITILTNFATGIIEEIIYRGVLYVWLLQKTDEITAFLLVQILFVLGHVPTLMINSSSMGGALYHALFIVLIGALHTVIFRVTKSLYASCFTHGLWNSLTYYLLLT